MKKALSRFQKIFYPSLLIIGVFVLGVSLLAVSGLAKASEDMVDSQERDFLVFKSQAAQEKRGRTPAQKKIDSQLLYALYRQRGEAKAKGVPSGELRVRFDEKGRAIVSIRARVTKTILARIKSLGGKIISFSEPYNEIRAHLTLNSLEKLAALQDIRAIMPAEEATTN